MPAKLCQIRDDDVDVGATPKKLVMRRDKVELFRYEPLGRARSQDACAYCLRIDRPLHHGRSPAGSLAGPQPAVAGARSLAGRLGPADAHRTVADDRRLCRRLYPRRGGTHLPRNRPRQVICSASARAAFSRPAMPHCIPTKVKNLVLTITPIDFHADTRGPRHPSRLPQCLDPKPRSLRTSTSWWMPTAGCPASS